MPANRLRNEQWRRSLEQIFERGGGLEISFPRARGGGDGSEGGTNTDDATCNLIWRVRILRLTDEGIFLEQPMALGETMTLAKGVELVAVMAVGQNRWMFTTRVLGAAEVTIVGRTVSALRIACPERVERCRRRNFYRVSTTELVLPKVTCWPLLNPDSVVLAEKANEMRVLASQNPQEAADFENVDEHLTMPEVGPAFRATLANIGGGGIGLVVEPGDAQALTRHRTFWLSIALPPEITVPLAVTAKLVHTHIDSSQKTYCGLAFEFGHNRGHQKFITDQIRRCVTMQQEAQLRRLRKAG